MNGSLVRSYAVRSLSLPRSLYRLHTRFPHTKLDAKLDARLDAKLEALTLT